MTEYDNDGTHKDLGDKNPGLDPEDENPEEYVGDPLIELLAIKLYEHTEGSTTNTWPEGRTCWGALSPDQRETFRDMARGKERII